MYTYWRCAPTILCTFHFFFHFWWVLNLDNFFIQNVGGCVVCVICYSNSIHSFIFIIYIMIVYTLKMCTSYFAHVSYFFSIFLRVLNLDIFSIRNDKGVPSFCIWNSNSIRSFIFKLCIMIFHTLKMCTFYFVHFSYLFFFTFLTGLELRRFFHP